MIVAGVNGGGTDTEAICCDASGRIVGRGRAGPSNYQNIGLDRAMAAINDALFDAGFPKPDILCVALAAINSEEDFKLLNGRLQSEHPGAILEHDAFAELYTKSRGGPGVLAISGTGSVILGYDGTLRHRRADMGWFLGDECSGYSIGKQGMMAAARMVFEDGPKTLLGAEITRHLKLKDPKDIMTWAYSRSNTVASVAALARAVEVAASSGDAIAISIMRKTSSRLAVQAAKMALRLGLKRVYTKGGVFRSRLFSSNFARVLVRKGLKAVPIKESAAMGSLLIAADKAGVRLHKR